MSVAHRHAWLSARWDSRSASVVVLFLVLLSDTKGQFNFGPASQKSTLFFATLPQRKTHPHRPRRNASHADTQPCVQRRDGLDKAVDAGLGSMVQGDVDGRGVARDAAHKQQVSFYFPGRPVRQRQLRQADGVHEVDVEGGVGAGLGVGVVGGRRPLGARREPKRAPGRLEDARARHDQVDLRKGGQRRGPEGGEPRPRCHVGPVEDKGCLLAVSRGVRVCGGDLLGLGAEVEVADDDGGAAGEEKLDKLKSNT